MRRRRLLSLVGGSTLLSGCSGLMGGETPSVSSRESPTQTASPSPPPTQSPSPSPEPCSALSETGVPTETSTPTTATTETSTPTTATTETATGDTMRTVELDYADPPPTAYDLDLQVALPRPEITTDETALVHVGLKNLAATEQTVQVGSFVPFSAYDSVDEDPGLALLPATRETERESDDCWTVGTDVIWEPLIEDFVDLAPCEAVWGAFEFWNHPDNDACLPPGEYRFESPYELGDVTETDSAGFYWGFELRVREA